LIAANTGNTNRRGDFGRDGFSPYKREQMMRRMSGLMATVVLMLNVGSVAAGSIRCQGEIIGDDQIHPLLESQVREKCGKPLAEEPRLLMYKTAANVTKLLRFNDAGELESITEQVGE
jgi:hypothetical protein